MNNLEQHALRVLSNNETLRKIEALREKGDTFLNLLRSFGNSRELDLAQVKVEEAVMWATTHLSAN